MPRLVVTSATRKTKQGKEEECQGWEVAVFTRMDEKVPTGQKPERGKGVSNGTCQEEYSQQKEQQAQSIWDRMDVKGEKESRKGTWTCDGLRSPGLISQCESPGFSLKDRSQ